MGYTACTTTMSLRARFYFALLVSFLAIGAHLVANHFYLYWTLAYKKITFVDIPIHMLGGVMAGLFVLVALRAFKLPEVIRNTLVGVFLIGATWEIIEVMYRVDVLDIWYAIDTVKDLTDDIIGGTIALYIWRKLPEPKSQDTQTS